MRMLTHCNLRVALLAAALFGFRAAAQAATLTATLPASALIEQFDAQKTSEGDPQASRSFTFSSDGIDWTLTFTAPEGNTLSDADLAKYGATTAGKNTCFGMPQVDYTDYVHIESFTLESDFFKDKTVVSVSAAAALLRFGEAALALPVRFAIGDVAKELTPSVATNLRSKIETLTFAPETPASGSVAVSSTFPGGAQFAFIELSVSYEESAPTAAATCGERVNVGHIVELACEDPDAEIFYALNEGAWTAYDAAVGIVLPSEGEHTLQYYAQAPGKQPSATNVAQYSVRMPSGIDYALTLANPVAVSGYVVGQAEGYTLIGKSPTADDADCLALANAEFAALRNASAGTPVSASGRASSAFSRAALDNLTDLYVDGRKVEPATTAMAIAGEDASAPVRTYDLQGRPSTRSRILISSAGSKRLSR